MNKTHLIITIALISVVICIAALPKPKPAKAPVSKPPVKTMTTEPVISELPQVSEVLETNLSEGIYQLTADENPLVDGLTNVYLSDYHGTPKTFLGRFSGIRNLAHLGIYINGTTYIMKGLGEGMHELWKYSAKSKPMLVYRAVGIDFAVSKDQKYIAVQNDVQMDILDGTKFKSLSKISMSKLNVNKDELPMIGLYGDTFDDEIWVTSSFGPNIGGFSTVNIKTFKVTLFPLAVITGVETDLNTETHNYIYSNFPAIFDEFGEQDFWRDHPYVELHLYNLDTKTDKLIMKQKAQFHPSWVNNTTIQYKDVTGKTIQKKVL